MVIKMKLVKFKNENANHSLYIEGERIVFVDGEADVDERVADAIKELKDPDYKVVEPKEKKPRTKKQPKKDKK